MKTSVKTARKLIKAGRACVVGKMSTGHQYPDGVDHWIINDNAAMRTLHVPVAAAPKLDQCRP